LAVVLEKTASNQIVLSGSIQNTSFFDILRDIALPKYSGMLKIKTGKKEYRYYFKEGIIIYAENSIERMDQLILSTIKQAEIVSRETVVKCEKMKSKLMKSLLEILIEEGHVSMLLYSKIISAAVRMNILEGFFARKGIYSFELRNSVREVHGVKSVDIRNAQQLASMSDEKLKTVKKILLSMNCDILTNKDAAYFSVNKSFLQNFLVTEIDFIQYISKAAEDFLSGGWTMRSRFATPVILKTGVLYLFRTFVLAGIFVFLYLATMTTTFETRKQHRSVKDFYFFKISLMSSLMSFESGNETDTKDLIRSGMILEHEFDLSGTEKSDDK
jgi:ribosomal protein S8